MVSFVWAFGLLALVLPGSSALSTEDSIVMLHDHGSLMEADQHSTFDALRSNSQAGSGFGSAPQLFDQTSKYSHRRQGFEEVVRYLKQLDEQPATGSGSSFGSAMLQDPQLAELSRSIEAQKSFIEKARKNSFHAEKMYELLTADRKGVLNAAPFLPNKLQKLGAETQLKRLSSALKHEKYAGIKWSQKQRAADKKLRELQHKQLTLQKDYVRRDAEARTEWLKKIAKQHVDFDLWRASHTGPENADYMKWKSQQKLNAGLTKADSQMEQIRTKLEVSLEKELRKEFTNVKHQVDSAKNHSSAVNIMESIKSLASNTDYQEFERTDTAERNGNEDYHDLAQKLSDDVQWFQYHANKAKAFAAGLKRKPLESNQAKIERLKGLFVAGLVRDKNQKKQRAKPTRQDHPVVPADTEAQYEVHQASNPDPNAQVQAEKQLNEQVEKAQVREHEWDKERDVKTTKLADRVSEDEANQYELNGLKLRAFESKAKLESVKKIKDLSAQMAALTGVAGTDNSESKAKNEMVTLNRKLKVAKAVYQDAKVTSKNAQQDMTQLKRKTPDDEETPRMLPNKAGI